MPMPGVSQAHAWALEALLTDLCHRAANLSVSDPLPGTHSSTKNAFNPSVSTGCRQICIGSLATPCVGTQVAVCTVIPTGCGRARFGSLPGRYAGTRDAVNTAIQFL